MNDDLLSIAISWFPLLLLLAVWFFFMWRGGMLKRGQMTNSEYLEAHLTETRRLNANLEALVARMDARIARLEDRRSEP
ncbi:MAG: hypothetical protein NW215_13560 [Hyphomicrobiales bacterium]|nr:hypothetical protein [Hyphomicrobiales bacterium]